MSSEGAFSYLTRDYSMKEAYLWPINADEQGTPQQVRKVIDLVRKNNIPVVFTREHDLRPRRQAGRGRDRRPLWRRALRRLAQRRRVVPCLTYLDLLKVTVETIAKGSRQ